MPLVRRAGLVLAAACFAAMATPAAATHAPQRGAETLTSTLTLRGTAINGSSQILSGRATIRTPAAWEHLNRSGSRSQRFRAEATDACAARIDVSPRAEATRRSAQAQVDRAMRFRVGALLSSGTRAGGGRWALAVHHDASGDPSAPPPAVHRTLYGIAVTPIKARRFVHTRVWVTMSAGCAEGDVRSGTVQAGVTRLLRRVEVAARIS